MESKTRKEKELYCSCCGQKNVTVQSCGYRRHSCLHKCRHEHEAWIELQQMSTCCFSSSLESRITNVHYKGPYKLPMSEFCVLIISAFNLKNINPQDLKITHSRCSGQITRSSELQSLLYSRMGGRKDPFIVVIEKNQYVIDDTKPLQSCLEDKEHSLYSDEDV
jgi:hypothetical protein